MSQPQRVIAFSHANGFPAGTYRLLFDAWRQAGVRVLALPKFGHDPDYPVTGTWSRVRDELVDYVQREMAHGPGGRVHLVGHSLGGYLSLLAACRRPDMAASVVMLDSPVIAGWRAHSVQVAKATRLIQRVSPGRISRTRRHHFDSAEHAHAHYAAKAVFARWPPEVLADYVAAGTEADAHSGGVRLAFDRAIETRLYNTVPHHMASVLRRHPPQCPVAFIGGTRSVEVRQVGLAATRAVTRGRIEWIEGTHLFPMEQPQATADAVLRVIGGAEADASAQASGSPLPTISPH